MRLVNVAKKQNKRRPLKIPKTGLEVEFHLIDKKGNISYKGLDIIKKVEKKYPNVDIIKECGTGIRLIHGSSNTICRNIITANNLSGIAVWGTSGNYIVGNNINNNNRGIYLETSGINIIHHNNFVNNTNDWWDYGLTPWPFQLPFSVNIWDDGKEGNYWGISNGTDNDGNGIGDTPYELYENNTDNYPLMEPVIISEFPSWIILPLFVTATLVVIIYRKKLTKAT